MYSLRLQYFIGDALVTDIRVFDKLHEVNVYIMEALENNDKTIQAVRIVKEGGR